MQQLLTSEEVREKYLPIMARILAAQENVRTAKNILSSAEGDLHRLKLDCPHENVTEGRTYQGGGRYYTLTTCNDCGKHGDRYRPDLTRQAYQDPDGNYTYTNRQEDYFKQQDEHERETHYLYGRYWKTAEDRRREATELAAAEDKDANSNEG